MINKLFQYSFRGRTITNMPAPPLLLNLEWLLLFLLTWIHRVLSFVVILQGTGLGLKTMRNQRTELKLFKYRCSVNPD
jgi:hypothetical protein